MKEITITPEQARRFLVSRLGLDSFQSSPHVGDTLWRLESIQEDSINICGRIHDLILWPRVRDYAPEKLSRVLYGPEAIAFEYWFPNLHILPLEDYPHFVAAMRQRALPGNRYALTEGEIPVAERFLAALTQQGALRTRAQGSEDGHTVSGWGTRATVVSQVAEKLWAQGRVAIAKRENFERYFDRTERVYPDVVPCHSPGYTPPDPEETGRHLALKRLRSQRLFRLKKGISEVVGRDALTAVRITGLARTWHCLTEDADLLASLPAAPLPPSSDVLLLAPLDPLVYDRVRTGELFGFDYTWEVYTPAARRRWGYYVLPILYQDRLIGRVDPKVDRKAGILHLLSLTLEPGVAPGLVAAPLAARLHAFARFLGVERILPAENVPAELCHLL